MSDHDPLLGTPPSDEEAEAARRLADSLDSGVPGDADPRALAVVNLLRGLSGDPAADASLAARARAELVTLASGLPARDEESFTAEEAEEARRLAVALESGTPGDADSRALAVSSLLGGLSGELPGDELAARRLRKELVAAASRARLRRNAGRVAAAAALVAVTLSGALLLRSPGVPSERLLSQREAAARAAVEAIATSGAVDPAGARLREQMDDLRSQRFASTLRSERLATLLGQADESRSEKKGGGTRKAPAAAHDSGGAL